MGRFERETLIVTGAARGMGASHARGFVREGANVVLADVLDEPGEALAAELGERALFVHLDVTSESEWQQAVEAARSRFGEVSVLVNNAGLAYYGTIAEGDAEAWRRVMDVNVAGQYLGIRTVVPSMRAAGGGAIVNISSIAGMTAAANVSAYVASKWAVRGFTKAAALELARSNIRVNSIHPGVVDTPMMVDPETGASLLDTSAFAIPRIADPDEVTRIVLFAASAEAGFVTGSEFVVDGGFTLGPVLAVGEAESLAAS